MRPKKYLRAKNDSLKTYCFAVVFKLYGGFMSSISSISFNDLIDMIKSYNPEEVEIITKAYQLAESLHSGQLRQSGEPYIIHPLNVAYILAEMHADRDTLCAALLHDTLEDTTATKEDIIREFNHDVANLVDGVTKISKMNYSSKEECNMANTRKIITGIADDVRIIIIKIADRLHNMRTLEFKSPKKQKENALETMEIFVPLANYIGTYRIKCELEDLSFKYLYPDEYLKTEDYKSKLVEDNDSIIKEMLYKIKKILSDRTANYEIRERIQNTYGLWKRLSEVNDIEKIHDFYMFRIVLEEVEMCYSLLYPLHQAYKPIDNEFRDYISNPKVNMYQSLHTTICGPEGITAQAQVRDFNMDRIASFGYPAYWNIHKGNARNRMQNNLREKAFYSSLTEMDSMFSDNKIFVERVKQELFCDSIIVYSRKSERIELPVGSTPIDFAYKIDPTSEVGNTMVKVYVNDEEVDFDYVLQTDDRIKIVTDSRALGPQEEWLGIATTSLARRRIKEHITHKN